MPPVNFIFLIGLPGSGKSHFARVLHASDPERYVVLSQDELGGSRSACENAIGVLAKGRSAPTHQDPKCSKDFCDSSRNSKPLKNSSKGPLTVIFDRCNVSHADRESWLRLAFDPPRERCTAVFFDVSEEECTRRVSQRVGHPTIPFGRGKTAVQSFAKQLNAKGERDHISIASPSPSSSQFSKVHVVRTFEDADALLLSLGCSREDVHRCSEDAAAMREGFIKFPRTMHLKSTGPGSASRDDLFVPTDDARRYFGPDAEEVCVEEKIDGANLGISIDPESYTIRFQNRSHLVTEASATQFKGLSKWEDEHAGELFQLLDPPDRYILFGEWCRVRHTVPYDRLPSYFAAFDIFDRKRNGFLSRQEFHAKLKGTRIECVPTLHDKIRFTSMEQVEKLLTRESTWSSTSPVEGIYIRIDDPKTGLLKSRCKLVRSGFLDDIELDGHWSKREPDYNRLEF